MTDDTRRLLETTDAAVWATKFVEIFRGEIVGGETEGARLDVGTMIGWFANAIETGRNEGIQQGRHQIVDAVKAMNGRPGQR